MSDYQYWMIHNKAIRVIKTCVEFCLDVEDRHLENLHNPQAIQDACALLGIEYETPAESLRRKRTVMMGNWVYPGGYKIWVDNEGFFQCQEAGGAVDGTTPAASLAEAEEMLAEAIR